MEQAGSERVWRWRDGWLPGRDRRLGSDGRRGECGGGEMGGFQGETGDWDLMGAGASVEVERWVASRERQEIGI